MTGVDPTPLGESLRAFRAAVGLSQEALAAKAGVTKAVIKEIETGRTRNPALPRLEALADALALAGADRDAFFAAASRGQRIIGSIDTQRLNMLEERVDRLEELLEEALRRRRR